MRAKASKALRWWTVGFFATVALLVGVEFSDRLVPTAWRANGLGGMAGIVSFSVADGHTHSQPFDLRWSDVSLGGIAVESWVQVQPLGPYTTVHFSVAGPTQAEAEAALVARATPWVAADRPELVPLLPKAVAAPGEQMRIDYPERRIVSQLMQLRSVVRVGQLTVWLWPPVLLFWLALLVVEWRVTLWPCLPNVCDACGYDRSGIAMDAVCPECGKRP